jgi:hypothetical protein
MKSFKQTIATLPSAKALNDDETILYFLTRNGLLQEIVPLHSKAQVIRAHREGSVESNLIRRTKSFKDIFVDVGSLRDYYGDETAVYFEWMNFL